MSAQSGGTKVAQLEVAKHVNYTTGVATKRPHATSDMFPEGCQPKDYDYTMTIPLYQAASPFHPPDHEKYK